MRVPGRLEVVGRHPLVVVDGAHNVAGMLVLARSLTEEFTVEGGPGRGGHAHRPRSVAMLEALLTAGVRSVVACHPTHPVPCRRGGGRGGGGRWAWRPRWPLTRHPVRLALARSGPEDRVVVCGSLYVVAEARDALGADAG